MSNCDHCKRGLLITETTDRAIEIKCSYCGRGWHISLNPTHISPCMNPYFSPPIPREVIRDEFFEHDEKPIESEAD